jgi:serine/threonine-protein kinase
MANVLQSQQKFGEAISFHKRAVEAYTTLYGPNHAAVANAKSRLAFTYFRGGMSREADSLFAEALAMQRAVLPDRHPHLASTLVRYGWVLIERGQPTRAEALIREGEVILAHLLPEDHWQIVAARGLMGLCWAQQGRFAEAAPAIEASYTTFREQFGPGDWRTQSSAQALARLYQAWGKPEQAQRYQQALAEASR